MKFKAFLGRILIDKEGEAKITLVVSKTEATTIMEIPTEVVLDVEISQE